MQYAIFGGTLRSDIPFPELRQAPVGPATWVFTRVTTAPADAPLEFLGEMSGSELRIRSYRIPEGFRLEYSDTGTFDVTEHGSRITWYPREGANIETARLDVIGRVLAMAVHATGVLTLHGSAVSVGSRGIAILAPKREGKSTLALALTLAGARLLADDSVPVDAATIPAFVYPGVHSLRLCGDAVTRAGTNAVTAWAQGQKLTLSDLSDAQIMRHRVPLAAVYVLKAVTIDAGTPTVRRTRLPDVAALMTVVAHSKLGSLLGGSEGPLVFDRIANLVQSVPVYELVIARDLNQIQRAAEQIRRWHLGVNGNVAAAAAN